MNDQLAFSQMLIDADERHRAALDELRSDVQQWFNALTSRQKDALGMWLSGPAEFDTCVALAAAAGDWNHTRQKELINEWTDLQRGRSGNGSARTGAIPGH